MAITAEKLSIANYNKLDSIPVINQDLSISEFTPVANTYYRHTGTTNTYTQGVIYYYDGMEYKALDGAGGISDVKVNGASVVTDGVANIPPASTSANGVVTTGAQTFSGAKKIIASPSDSVQLELRPTVPATGRAYSKIRFNGITSSGNEYPFTIGMSEINTLSFRHMTSYTGTYFRFSNYNGQSFEINVNTGGYTGGQVNCGAGNYQLYLKSKGAYNAVPTTSGTLMSTPDTWSSGTSGSVTLSAGLYEIKASLSKLGIGDSTFTTTINFDGSTQTVSSAFVAQAESGTLTSYYFMVSNTGVVTLRMEDSNGTGEDTITFSYRKIGIA